MKGGKNNMAKNAVGSVQKSLSGIPKLVVISVVAGLLAMLLNQLTGLISGWFTGIGDLGIIFIVALISLTIFTYATSMKKIGLIDLIPVLIISPLVVAVLTALNLGTIPLIDSNVELGASLGLTVASVVLANSIVGKFRFFK